MYCSYYGLKIPKQFTLYAPETSSSQLLLLWVNDLCWGHWKEMPREKRLWAFFKYLGKLKPSGFVCPCSLHGEIKPQIQRFSFLLKIIFKSFSKFWLYVWYFYHKNFRICLIVLDLTTNIPRQVRVSDFSQFPVVSYVDITVNNKLKYAAIW